jgi:hypothetical protein
MEQPLDLISKKFDSKNKHTNLITNFNRGNLVIKSSINNQNSTMCFDMKSNNTNPKNILPSTKIL